MALTWTWTEQTHNVSPDNEHEVEIFITAEDENGESVIQSSASFWIKPFGPGGAAWCVSAVGGELLPSESNRGVVPADAAEEGGEDPLALAHIEVLDHIQRILERRLED
jgi:hypothetical protein